MSHIDIVLRKRYNLDARESMYRPLELREAIDNSIMNKARF
jgi:hypothetical protein